MIFEYADVNTISGADDAELYVVDSYEYLEGGQGDLGDMYYVTSLGHSNFDIHLGEAPSPQVLSEVLLDYDANIYYSGHHTDFNRQLDASVWTGVGTAAAASSPPNAMWNDHEAIFFAWYDPDDTGGAEAFEIAVKYDTNKDEWRIANKEFDTFSDITLSIQDANTLNAMSTAIQNDPDLEFKEGDSLRVYLGAAYQDISDVIDTNDDVSQWEFYHPFSTSRSTYYIEIPNGSPSNSQQVKVVNVLQEDGVTYAWELRADEEILVNIPALSVIASNIDGTEADESASVVAGGNGAELISAGDGADTMLGGGGADTYAIGVNDSDEYISSRRLWCCR